MNTDQKKERRAEALRALMTLERCEAAAHRALVSAGQAVEAIRAERIEAEKRLLRRLEKGDS